MARKFLAIVPAAILVVAFAIQVPSLANAQGGCTVTGTGTGYEPGTETFTSTDNSTGTVITYLVETSCLDKRASTGDS